MAPAALGQMPNSPDLQAPYLSKQHKHSIAPSKKTRKVKKDRPHELGKFVIPGIEREGGEGTFILGQHQVIISKYRGGGEGGEPQ